MDMTKTQCPYCAKDKNEQSTYKWRVVEIPGEGRTPGTTELLRTVEIYCEQCHRTLSFTPIYPLQSHTL